MVKVVICILCLGLMACNTMGKSSRTGHPAQAIVVGGGYSIDVPDNHELDHTYNNDFGQRSDSFSNKPTFHLAYERQAGPKWFDWFAAYDYVPFDQKSVSKINTQDRRDVSVDVNTFTFGAKASIKQWKVKPFVLFGLGGMHVATSQHGNPTGTHIYSGLGIDIPVSARFGLQLLGTHTKGRHWFGDDMTDYRYGNIIFGIKFSF